MRVVGYCRVSTEEQNESGLSLSHQAGKINGMANLQDWTLLEIIEDGGVSAKDLNRDGIQEILRLVRARRIDGVIVSKLDRLTRSVRDLIDILKLFERYGVSVISTSENLDTGSAAGRFFIGLLALVSEWERETIGERTSNAMQQLKQEGRRYSGLPPYGFRFGNDASLVEIPEEQEIIAFIRELSAEGLSVRKIRAELERRGIQPRSGGRWSSALVNNLKNRDV